MNKKLLKKSIVILPANDENAIELLNAILTEYGFNPVTIRKWEDAQAIVAETCPDLIVMNLDKPDHFAVEKLDTIRNCMKTKDVPVIIVSSLDRYDFDMNYPLSGKEMLITKPIPSDAFITTVKKAIDKK